jgi:AcrR family transcriptional regulator
MRDTAGRAQPTTPARARAARTDPAARRDQIVEAAATLLREHSYADITMRMLQDHLGLSKGGVYHHVSSKHDILFLACEEAGRAMLAALADAQAVDGPTRAKLDRLVEGHLRVVKTYGGALWAFFSERDKLPPEQRDLILSLERDYLKGIVDLFRRAQAAGEVHDDVDPRLLADALLGMLNWFTRWRTPSRVDEGRLSAAFARIFAEATFTSAPADRRTRPQRRSAGS